MGASAIEIRSQRSQRYSWQDVRKNRNYFLRRRKLCKLMKVSPLFVRVYDVGQTLARHRKTIGVSRFGMLEL